MMNFIKVIVSVSFLIFLSTTSKAQRQEIANDPSYGADSASRITCASNLSTMSEFVKIKVFDYALNPWRYCFNNCPGASKNIYIQGARIIKHKIESAGSEEVANAYIDTLMLIYDKRIEYFGDEGNVLGKKGIDLLKYRKEELEEAYNYLERSVDLEKGDVDEAVAATFMTVSSVLYKSGKIEGDVVINNYIKTIDALEIALENTRNKSKTERAIESVEKAFAESGAAGCDALVEIFTPKYEATPDDIELLKKITQLLDDNECQDSELFAKASESLYKLEPSPKAASNLALLFALQEDYAKAEDYYLKAIEQETDNELKADYYYQLAAVQFKLKDYPSARKNALNAIDIKADYGDAYILIGNAYAASSSSCGSTKVEKGAVYWTAVDKFIKAKNVDRSVTEKANELINRYSKYFPYSEDAFFEGLSDGQSYTVKCWINESTIVRTVKNN